MANEATLNKGTQITLEASFAQFSDGGVLEAADASRASTDNAGYPLGIFEFATASSSPFSGLPGDGTVVHLYEQKIVGGSNDAPDVVASDYEHDYLWTFNLDNDNTNQGFYESPPLPININGGKYWLKFVPATAATTMDAGASLKLTPVTYGTS